MPSDLRSCRTRHLSLTCTLGPPYRRVRVWKVLVSVATALSVAIGGLAWWYSRKIDERWAAMEARTAELIREAINRKALRPVPRGEPLPGNAWDDYELAFAEIAKLGRDKSLFNEFNSNPTWFLKRADVERLLADHASALEFLKRGARRQDAINPHTAKWLTEDLISGTSGFMALAGMAEAKARLLLEGKRPVGAMDLLLDVCRLACDVGQSGPLVVESIAYSVYLQALEPMSDVLNSQLVGPEGFLRLAKDLEVTERTLPRHFIAVQDELPCFGSTLLRRGPWSVDENRDMRPLKARMLAVLLFAAPGRVGAVRKLRLRSALREKVGIDVVEGCS